MTFDADIGTCNIQKRKLKTILKEAFPIENRCQL